MVLYQKAMFMFICQKIFFFLVVYSPRGNLMNSSGTRNSSKMSGVYVFFFFFCKSNKLKCGKNTETRKINWKSCARLIKRIRFHQMKRKYVYLLTGHPLSNILDVNPNKPNIVLPSTCS